MIEKIKRNIWNIISVIGTIATLVFGIYGLLFVPNYIKDVNKERQIAANREIVTDIKEIIYSNTKSDSLIVPTLKTGKELKYDIVFPKTNIQILVEVQEEFMNDKFLPLEQRMILYSKVDSLKAITPNVEAQMEKSDGNAFISSLITYTLSILSLLLSGLLIFSLFIRRKEQINETLEKKYEEIQDTRPEVTSVNRDFEKTVADALTSMNIEFTDFTKNPKDFAFDFLINNKEQKIGIEVKSNLRASILKRMNSQFEKSELNVLIIVINQILDFSTFNLLSDYTKQNNISGKRIYFITANNIDKLKGELIEVLNSEK